MANVTLRNVRKSYPNGFEAIKGVDVDVADGQFCVLVGPSGCGKSTLLRMVAGLETITGGEIDIGGRIVNQVEPAERDIAMVFQNYALYPHMSVYNNMAYGLRNRRMPQPEIDTRVQEAARILELGAMLDRKPGQLSGGQRQRVAMGRAIVRQPKVFLFDEPLSNLDAKLRQEVRLEIRQLQRELGLTTVFVTHDQEEALTVADRLAVMNHGVIAQVGTPRELYDAPRSVFVADFIGKSNFFEGEIAEPGVFRTGSGLRIHFAGAGRPGVAVLAVRPERMAIRRGTAGSGGTEQANSVPGVTKVVTFLGPTTEAMIELASGERVLVHAPTAQRDGAGPVPGEAVRVTWPPDASLLLDASERAPARNS